MAQWSQPQFEEDMRKKYEILGQQANADTTRANATMQGVQQQPGMQGAADVAAMERARLASQTQLGAEQLRGGFGLGQTSLAGQNAANVENLRGGFGLQQTGLAGQNAANVATIQGGYGLEGDRLRTQAMMQPQYETLENRHYDPNDSKSLPYYSAPKNQAAMDRPPTVPGGLAGTGVGGLPGFNGLPASSAQAKAPAVGGLPIGGMAAASKPTGGVGGLPGFNGGVGVDPLKPRPFLGMTGGSY
ncbi:hypothetical protein [Solidesulfovibrio sp.]